MNDDAVVIEAVKTGDRERYAELVRRYERLVYGISWSQLGDAHLSEEAAQETFVQGFRFLAALRRPESFSFWIGKIARNIASNIARRRRHDIDQQRRWLLEQEPDEVPRQPSADTSLAETLREVLAQLPNKHRECLVLFYLEQKSIRESARALDISEETFRVRLHRARNAVRLEMQERLEGPLQSLAPKEGFGRRVLSCLPAAPVGMGWSAWAALSAGVIKVLPTILLVGWTTRQTIQNYRDPQDYRRALLRRNFPKVALMMILSVASGILLFRHGGLRTLATVLLGVAIPATFKALMLLRVNRSRFAVVQLFGLSAMSIAFATEAMGWVGHWAFFAAMILFNIALWFGRKSMPARNDYHLALRAAQGELGPIVGHKPPRHAVTPDQMRRFAQLLGRLFLIMDYSLRKGACRMAMMGIGLQMLRHLWPWREFTFASSLVITADGSCRVALSKRDWQEIQALHPRETFSREQLELRTAEAVEEALAVFLAGDEPKAVEILQRRKDEQILRRPVHELRSFRTVCIISIIAAIVGVLMMLAAGSCSHNGATGAPPPPVTVQYVNPIVDRDK